eukprot:TRINITY_DN109830_c0_g1_i1.p1 TRINITY_DN109830_c0_g1~~TRINITY_DN109830_c0_g1_i1.p1  ORF type:complete len:352 (+),score=38.80 TRINITY_DN109830_c0_g1_i1:67-1122(+)
MQLMQAALPALLSAPALLSDAGHSLAGVHGRSRTASSVGSATRTRVSVLRSCRNAALSCGAALVGRSHWRRKHLSNLHIARSTEEDRFGEDSARTSLDDSSSSAQAADAVVVIDDLPARRDQGANLKRTLDSFLRLAAATDRGQRLTTESRKRCEELLSVIEAGNPTRGPARSPLLEGKWQLVYASEDITRSSPFFWACRQLKLSDPTPFSSTVLGSDSLVDAVFAITDNIPLTYMGVATQLITSDTLLNQVGVGVFLTGENQMTTTCNYSPDPADSSTLLVRVRKTQVLGTGVAANVLRGIDIPSGDWFTEALGEETATVRMNITYLDDSVRVVRDARRSQSCFVYVRCD